MFKKWKERKAKERKAKEKIDGDAYLARLRNSHQNLSGLSHSTGKPTLSIAEVEYILGSELDRRTQ